MTRSMNKILVVDNHPIILKGVVSMLTGKNYTVLEAENSEQAIVIHKHIPDINLMICALSLPTIADGIGLIEHIRSVRPQIPIIVFTMHDEPWHIKTLMNIGADGIVLKGENPNELLLAIDSVLNNREKFFSPLFCKMRNEVMKSSGILSRREIEIIRDISSGCKNREIAEKYGISEKTIEYHRSSILRKFGVKTIAEAIRRVCEMGLLQ